MQHLMFNVINMFLKYGMKSTYEKYHAKFCGQ